MARRQNYRNERDKFYIITNGEATEDNYFRLLKTYRSIYDVEIEFQNHDPLALVNYARKYTQDANQVWCVFDVDNSHKENKLIPALTQAEKFGIKIAYSNVAFEVWLISHFQKCASPLNTKDHQKILNEYLAKKGFKGSYEKSDKEMLKRFFIPFYTQAISNAKVVYQTYIKEHTAQYGPTSRYCIWDWNSSTTVFKLVEALNLQKK